MANTLQIKRGSGTPSSLAAGELGVDTSAKKLYSSDGSSVFQIGSAGAPGVLSLTADGNITAGDTVSLTDEGKVKRTRTDGYGSVDTNVDNYSIIWDGLSDASFAYDKIRNILVFVFRDDSNSEYLTAVVYTMQKGNKFSESKKFVLKSEAMGTHTMSTVYCEGPGKFVTCFKRDADGSPHLIAFDVVAHGKDDWEAEVHQLVGASSGDILEVHNVTCNYVSLAWDVGLQRLVVAYQSESPQDGYIAIAKFLGTAASDLAVGTPLKWKDSGPSNAIGLATNGFGKGVMFYKDENTSSYGYFMPFSIDPASDMTPTVGTATSFLSAAITTDAENRHSNTLYDPNRNQFYYAYCLNSNGEVNVASVTLDDFDTANSHVIKGNSSASNWGSGASGEKPLIIYNPLDGSQLTVWGEGTLGKMGQQVPGFRQNTNDISDEEHTISNVLIRWIGGFYNEKSHRTWLLGYDSANSQMTIHNVRGTESNADQFFGIAQADISSGTAGNIIPYGSIDEVNGGLSAICGPTCRFGNRFDAEEFASGSAVYDSTNDAVVIFYQDSGNSNYGTAVVGKIDPVNNTISFGTPVAFNSSSTDFTANSSVYDPDAGRVVAFYTVSNKGYAIVGNVSNNTISFGTAVQFNGTDNVYDPCTAYDTNTDRIGVFYSNNNASLDGAVATVTAGTNAISFGSATTFYDPSASAGIVHNAVFMDSHNKIFVNYADPDNSKRGTGIVATITGGTTNSVAFGTASNYSTDGPDHSKNSIAVWDSTNNKLCIFFENEADSDRASLVVATVSGTTISYGSILDYDLARTASAAEYKGSFDPDTGNILFMCRHTNQEVIRYPAYQQVAFVARVSGTASTATVSRQISGTTGYHYANLVYDSTSKRHVEFGKLTNTEWGTGKTSAFDPSYAKVWQVGFIPGEDHYVQGSGAIIAADKHQSNLKSTLIKAGVGLSKTKILLKGAKYG